VDETAAATDTQIVEKKDNGGAQHGRGRGGSNRGRRRRNERRSSWRETIRVIPNPRAQNSQGQTGTRHGEEQEPGTGRHKAVQGVQGRRDKTRDTRQAVCSRDKERKIERELGWRERESERDWK